MQQVQNTHKRPGAQLIRDRVELKKVLKTHKSPPFEKSDEFDIPPEKIFDFISNLPNPQNFTQVQTYQTNNPFPSFMFQQNPVPNNSSTCRPLNVLNESSSQETRHSNKVTPIKLVVEEPFFNTENSIDSCDSSGKKL